jgi:hypothetical protein
MKQRSVLDPSIVVRTVLVRLQRFALTPALRLCPLALVFCVCACGQRSEFDISPDQVTKRAAGSAHEGGMKLDTNHLPPGAVKTLHKYKKGDVLPDGTVADRDRTVTMVTMEKDAPGGRKRKLEIAEEQETK